MRFSEFGPSIPSELLTARDRGEVVFFCGAGVSKPAGLAGFFELTVQVMKKLGVSKTSKIGSLMADAMESKDPSKAPPFDQVFGRLQSEFLADRVAKEVASLLRIRRNTSHASHDIVLRLSRTSHGDSFVVTTNFDRLFERARRGIDCWVPPRLPSLADEENISGVVYLHGRLEDGRSRSRVRNTLVLGSGDFGRAYLAEGWATTFVRQLLERRIVVLLGYSANDPPVRYLLEGLQASPKSLLRPIYAFDQGSADELVPKWRDLGVKAIPFDEFDNLWSTLASWADRSDDPVKWQAAVLKNTIKSPQELKPFERGQIASIISSTDGAKAFSEFLPPPRSEWLCVLDRNVRYTAPFKRDYHEGSPEIDPLEHYGIDDDLPRTESNEKAPLGVDFIGRLPDDEVQTSSSRMAGVARGRFGPPLRRLWWLSRWFETIAHEPIAIWWAGRQTTLDADLLWAINRRLTGHGERFDEEANRLWLLLYEVHSKPKDIDDMGWLDFAAILKRTGWTSTTYRAFEDVIRPRLILEPESLRQLPMLMTSCSFGLADGDLIAFKTHFSDQHGQEVVVPAEAAPRVVRLLMSSLEYAIDLLADTGRLGRSLRLPTINPDDRPGDRYLNPNGLGRRFLWAAQTFKHLAEINPAEANKEVQRWPNDPDIFDKLRLYAWSFDTVVPPAQVAVGIAAMSNSSFWGHYSNRECLHMLRARWPNFSEEQRSVVEAKKCEGFDFPHIQDSSVAERYRSEDIVQRLGWLSQNGCDLTDPTRQIFIRLSEEIEAPADVGSNADHDADSRSGWVRRVSDPSGLLTAPLHELFAKVEELSTRSHGDLVENVPFEGLVEKRPGRALAALNFQAKQSKYPLIGWRQLLTAWPKGASSRATGLAAKRMTLLPADTIIELRYYLPQWLQDNANKLMPAVFYELWDVIFSALQGGGIEAVISGIGEVTVGGRVIQKSRKTLNHAINAPVGHLVEALFKTLGEKTLEKNEKLPGEVSLRLEQCLRSLGEGGDHAVLLLARDLSWLYFVDFKWTRNIVFPCSNLTSPRAEAFWNGFITMKQVPQNPTLFAALKKPFLHLFDHPVDWFVDDDLERKAAHILIIANYWRRNSKLYLSDADCRETLKKMSDGGRQSALWMVHQIIDEGDGWTSFGKRFFSDIWPQESRFQTSGTSRTLMMIADDKSNLFPEIVAVIEDYLRPIEHADSAIFSLRRPTEPDHVPMSKRWPKQVLEVANRIIEPQGSYVPYGLDGLLSDIAEAEPAVRTTELWRRLHDLTRL